MLAERLPLLERLFWKYLCIIGDIYKRTFVLACRFAPTQQVVCLHGGKDHSAPKESCLVVRLCVCAFPKDLKLATTRQAILADEDKILRVCVHGFLVAQALVDILADGHFTASESIQL